MNCLSCTPIIVSVQIDGQRVGVCGASMGGMTALGALARYDCPSFAEALMGSGDFMRLHRTLFPPMMLDVPDYERRFAAALAPLAESTRLYQPLAVRGAHHRVRYLIKPEISHEINVSALVVTVAFFMTSFSVAVERRAPAA